MKIRTQVASIAGVLLGLLINAIVRLGKDSIIIHFGYGSWRTVNIIAIAILIVSSVACIAVSATAIVRRSQQKQRDAARARSQRESELAAKSRQKLDDPADVQTYFYELWSKHRGLPRYAAMANLSHDIVDQLRSMDDYQQRLENLLTINDIGAMQSAREILQQIEDSICRNCKGIINRFIATDDPDEFVDAANEAISTNRQTLCQVEDFLKTLATYASGQDDGSDAEASLELCCAQMRSMLSEEDF